MSSSESRAISSGRNALFGVLLKSYQIIMPFIMRTAMIYYLGVEYLGLNGLFVSVLQFLNLAELGVGSAMVYSMYKPIADKDNETICALLALYRHYYRIIGFVVLVLGSILAPFLPVLIHGEIPSDLNLYALYALYLGGTLATYWLFAYKTSLLQAMQRIDIVSKVSIGVNTVMYITQFILIMLGNYYGYVVAYIASLILINAISAFCAKKRYPLLKPQGRLSQEVRKDIGSRIKDLFTAKMGGVLLNSAPTIIVSAFFGLATLAIYQNYFFIVQSVTSLVGVVFTACLASIGNSIVVETKETNYGHLRVFTLIMTWIIGFCSCCILCLTQPFMEVWVGADCMLSLIAVIAFSVYFFIFNMTVLLTTFKDAAGIWHQDRFRPLVTSVMSLILCFILIRPFGVYGVIVATPIAQAAVALPWVLHNLFSYLFSRSMLRGYLKEFIFLSLVSIILCGLLYCICSFLTFTPVLTLFVRLLVCFFGFNLLFLLVVTRMPEFMSMLTIFNRITSGKLGVIDRMIRHLSR